MRKQRGNVTPIRLLGDPVLRETSREVETFDTLLVRLYEDMLETMYQAPGVGLAAPQIGLSLRFFVYDAGEGAGPGCVANPALSDHEGSHTDDEGCLSIPHLYFQTERAESVRLDGFDLSGNPISIVGTGLRARIFQHESDHLNGTLFIDRLKSDVRREALAAIRDREFGAGSGPAHRDR